MTSRFAAVRVRPTHSYRHGEQGEEPRWLLSEWLAGQPGPTRHWLANLPPTTDLATLVRQTKIRWRIEQGYQQPKDELELDQYEGRRWQGWHHHVTLTMMAFRLARGPSGPPALRVEPRAETAGSLGGRGRGHSRWRSSLSRRESTR